MYTVVRVIGNANQLGLLHEVGLKLNGIEPDLYQQVNKKRNRIDCSIAETRRPDNTGTCWNEHRIAIISFLQRHRKTLCLATGHGLEIQFDTAVWRDDHRSISSRFLVDIELMRALTDARATLVLSMYFANKRLGLIARVRDSIARRRALPGELDCFFSEGSH